LCELESERNGQFVKKKVDCNPGVVIVYSDYC
jgi:hypothetical protein